MQHYKTIFSYRFGFLTLCCLLPGIYVQAVRSETIDPDIYYRLTTEWFSTDKSLDVVNDGTNNLIQLATTGNYSGQFWKFTPLSDGYYRLTTQWQGDGKSLDVVNDGTNNRLQLADTGNFSGQHWKITPLDNGYVRLTTQWQGDGKSLDVINDGTNNLLQLADSGNFSGQHWKLTPAEADSSQSTSASSANGKYRDLVQTMPCPQDKAQYGEFKDYGYWGGGEWCGGKTGQAGYWVWSDPNWYVWSQEVK